MQIAYAAAAKKDSGLTPAQLAWFLSEIEFDDDVRLPGEVPARELRDYLHYLIDRLKRLSLPQ